MKISDIQGLKYPNESFVKYFFNMGFENCESKKFIEFGSSNGNNLSLPYQYNHEIIGVDIDSTLTEFANKNFKLYESNSSCAFYTQDMLSFINNHQNLNVDVFLLPNIINYLAKHEFIDFLKLSREKNLYKDYADFFLRARSIKDFRFGKGKKLGENSYRLNDSITGEDGAICTCYQEFELIDILKEHLHLSNFKVFSLDNQNLHSDTIVNNADIVIWGKIH
ncbi:class I SAM-dependent methyltransferase [Sulfurimonas sp.]|uniref:class I SAM-dependent methyltransferase n=1 Tax=Sulfurimonas sp. TaxID=2022749 RepID=UPI0025FEE2DE|nr:class I SAM-dependent methyltransferase [Sulfurimonas sp.]